MANTKVRSRLTAQGQISVPAEVRNRLGLAPGSVLEWQEEQGQYIVRRAGRHTSEQVHEALFPKPPKTATLSELKTAIPRRIKRKHARR
jgi:AbrB family looped-hinge helix DNA binding protein